MTTAAEEEIGLYTPFVLRTGFMHSYRITSALLLLVILLEAVFWTLGGFWPRLVDLGLLRWGLIAILTIVVPIGTGTIRDIVGGYANLFGVFDEETEERLELYRSLNRPSSKSQFGMQRLFKDNDSYAAFQERIRQVVFDRFTEIIVFASTIVISAFVLYNTIYEKIALRASMSRSPLVILEILIDAYATIFLILALSFILTFGIGYFYILNRLGRSQSDLGIWNYIQHLGGTPVSEGSFMSYWRFLDYASTIGKHFARVAFRIVLLMTFGGLAQVQYNVSMSTLATWFLAAIPVVLSVLILVLPLLSLHRVMDKAKLAILRELDEEYDHLTLRFLTLVSKERHSQTPVGSDNNNETIAVKINALRRIIDDTRQQSTWPVEAPVVFRIISPSLIPIAISTFKLLRELGVIN